MQISPISNGIVLPADVQEVEAKGGSGKPIRETTKRSDQPEKIKHEPGTVEPSAAPVEPVINGLGLGLRFYNDRAAGVRVIQVVDEASGDIIRQIPPDEVVDFMRQFKETKGHFVSLRS